MTPAPSAVPGAAAAPALQATGLTKVYGSGNTEVQALRGVDLSLGRGEVVALLGPSGAGKSTLLGILGLINQPTTGHIAVDGSPVVEDGRFVVDVRAFRRERMGFVFQKANLIAFLTAVENVQVALEMADQPSALARARALELLDYLGVADRADHYPTALSGGQQQRVAVARALANRPSLIFADEPTAALDSVRGRQVMELFAKVAHEHETSVLVVTHDHRALDAFDRTIAMEDGRLVDPEGGQGRDHCPRRGERGR
jgi:putative ABC transport system ATP-binding protein